MARFVLKFNGPNPRQADIDLIKRTAGVEVLDHEVAQALLVDAPPQAARQLDEQLPDWTVAGEESYPPPGPAKRQAGGKSDQTG